MSDELQQQSETHFNQDAKLLGLSIYNRLRLLKDELVLNTERTIEIKKQQNDDKSKVKIAASTLVKNFFILKQSGEIISRSNSYTPHHGKILYKEIYENKILSKPLLLTFPPEGDDAVPFLYLIAPVDATSTKSDFIGAELNTANILGIEMINNSNQVICILSESDTPLYCNNEPNPHWVTSVADKQKSSTNGFYLWQNGEEKQYTAFWSLFLEAHYQVDKWTIVIASRENPAQQSLDSFQSALITVVSLITFIVILLSIPIIRNRILPLESILSATRELAEGKFETRINIKSGDEFQEIGSAINSMTEKLGLQFEYQRALSIISPQMLKAEKATTVFRSIHHQLVQLDAIARIGVVNLDKNNTAPEAFIYPMGKNFPTDFSTPLENKDINDLPKNNWSGQGNDMLKKYPCLQILEPQEQSFYALIPIKREDMLISVIAIELLITDQSIKLLLEQIGDITTNALSNIILSREIKYQANYDSVTHLPNRFLFLDRLEQAISKADRDDTMFAVLFFDLDRFKQINDSLGHTIGDEVLKLVAKRLEKSIRNEDSIARLGGDEFVVIAEAQTMPEGAAILAEKLNRVLEEPYFCRGHELFITGSIGISLYPKDGHDADTLIRNADSAMYRAKNAGANTFHFYSPEMTERAFDRILMEKNLRVALKKSEFEVYYQPQYDLQTFQMIGLEALIRWPHPTLGFIPPFTFIPIAEETGMINEIGAWVMESACRQICLWKQKNELIQRVSVNMSAKQLQQDNLVDLIKETLITTGCNPDWLEIEITESYLMSNPESAILKLEQLRALGVSIAIDDFGTGYSSLSYLKKLPISKLKIDKSFVDDVPTNPDDVAITKAIIALGKSMKMKLIAEGVETIEQQEFLKANGCDEVQGYLYSKPMPVSKLIDSI